MESLSAGCPEEREAVQRWPQATPAIVPLAPTLAAFHAIRGVLHQERGNRRRVRLGLPFLRLGHSSLGIQVQHQHQVRRGCAIPEMLECMWSDDSQKKYAKVIGKYAYQGIMRRAMRRPVIGKPSAARVERNDPIVICTVELRSVGTSNEVSADTIEDYKSRMERRTHCLTRVLKPRAAVHQG